MEEYAGSCSDRKELQADLKLSFRKMFADQFANVYKLSGKSLEFMGCVKLDEDGAAVISGVDSAGEYVVMVCGFSDLHGDITNDGVLNALNAAADKSFHFSVPLRNLSGRIFLNSVHQMQYKRPSPSL